MADVQVQKAAADKTSQVSVDRALASGLDKPDMWFEGQIKQNSEEPMKKSSVAVVYHVSKNKLISV